MFTRSLLPLLAARSGALLSAVAVVFAGCDAPLTPDGAAAISSAPFLQVAGDPAFASVGLGSGLIDSRIHLRTHPERDVKIVTAKVTVFPSGGFVPWHTHAVPGVLVVVTGGGALTVTSEDCSSSTYPTGTAFQPPHVIHMARNLTSQPIELYATFRHPGGQEWGVPAPDDAGTARSAGDA